MFNSQNENLLDDWKEKLISISIKKIPTIAKFEIILQLSLTKSSTSDNLQGQIYPIIAKAHKRTPQNIKNSIINATEYMYRECNAERLRKYFSFSNDAKPSVKQVIFTITNKITR